MARLALESILIALAVLTVVNGSENESGPEPEPEVELEFHPSFDHRQGDTMKIVCKVPAGELLDIVKLVKVIDGKEYEIATNDFMVESFMDTGRYSMLWSDNNKYKEAGFTIKKAKGEDSGTIGCKHILLDGQTFTAFEEFSVSVPPKSVDLKAYNGGVEEGITEGQIILREGHDSGIECIVVVDGSHASPVTTITLDGEDAMHKFTKEENKTKNPNHGLVQMKTVITYEYLFSEPDLDLNGQKLECKADVEGFETLSSSADLSVHYAPRVECDAAGAEMGEKIILRCRGHMHPRLDLVSVTWKRKPETFTLTQTEPDLGRHHLNVTDNGDGSYNFDVTIDEVIELDFGSYKVEVQNAHDLQEIKIKLVEVIKTTTTTTTTTTSKPTDPVDEVTKPTSAVGRASITKSVCAVSLLLAILPLFLS